MKQRPGRPGARAAGFTLVELIVVMAVLGVLASLVMPLAELSVRRDRERELKRALWQIRDAIDEYHKLASTLPEANAPNAITYPPDLRVLVEGVPDPQRPGARRVFLRSLPRDPFAGHDLPAEATWALRSYASPHDRPEPGRDVFDIASRSDRVGLNGIPLKDW